MAIIPVVVGSNQLGLLIERLPFEEGNVDLSFPLSGLGNVVAILHPHQSVHRDAKGLLNTQHHLGRQARTLFDSAARVTPNAWAALVTESPRASMISLSTNPPGWAGFLKRIP